MLFKWLPWKYMMRRAARANGFLDPVLILSRLQSFAQPSEVGEPIELLRAGMVFHARGLLNTRAIQNNMDWIWPYWVERQFNPHDISFIPRAFSISHVNLSHRNWTAVGVPDSPCLPIIDPSGLATPFFDGWSLDAWILQPGGKALIPSKSKAIAQSLEIEPAGLAVETSLGGPDCGLHARAEVLPQGSRGLFRLRLRAQSDRDAWLAVSLRPYNPEGVSFIEEIRLDPGRKLWSVDGEPAIAFSEPVEKHFVSSYQLGDVFHKLLRPGQPEDTGMRCGVGLATGAALFSVSADKPREIFLDVDLAGDRETRKQFPVPRPSQGPGGRSQGSPGTWEPALAGLARLELPDERYVFLYDAAVRSLLLHSPGEVFPGPYTYKRFWFRDAAFILNAMLAAGMRGRVERALDLFPTRQTLGGYFLSQEGEWDSNGEALWILQRFCRFTGTKPKQAWAQPVAKAAEWITRKRGKGSRRRGDRDPRGDGRVAGLLPAGFSAEHLGPIDFYYWDDFWGVAGLEAASSMLDALGMDKPARAAAIDAAAFRAAIERSVGEAQRAQATGMAVPASPFRRMDSGAVGSLAADYPLALWPAGDARILATADFLWNKCLYKGGFFQDMIHSGINAYLTLELAQVFLRAGDARWFALIRDTAALATPTGQWPEAIHPHTLGGCMGDGHHVWAAAEWVFMMRNLFLREEGETLILASGMAEEWVRAGGGAFGPAPCEFGTVSVTVRPEGEAVRVAWEGHWHTPPRAVEVRIPGRPMLRLDPTENSVLVPPRPVATLATAL